MPKTHSRSLDRVLVGRRGGGQQDFGAVEQQGARLAPLRLCSSQRGLASE